MSIDLVILCIIMALYIGFKAGEAWYLYTFRQILEDLNIKQSDLRKLAEDKGVDLSEVPAEEDDLGSDLPILEVRVEQHPEGLFAYRKMDDSFIAQGKDRDTLMENLVNNLTNVRVVVYKDDGADLINP
jgi:hypothetical protein